MRRNDWLKMAAVLAALCLAPLGSHARQQSSSQQDSQQTGDPVADAARKAREQKEKKNAQKPKKVYTDDDVRPAEPEKPSVQNATASTPAIAGTEGAATATATGAVKDEDTTKKEDPNGEKAWRKRFSDQHQKIASVEKEIDVLQRELQKAQLQYYTDPQKAMNEQNSRTEINNKTGKIDAKKKELEQLKQQLDDLETELRKSGGDPGWAQ